jgi:hypothetical protein
LIQLKLKLNKYNNNMAKKLKLLIVLLIMSLATFSQTGTTKSNLICFPDTVAKKIAIDLVRGDSAKAELIKTKLLVIQLENKDLANQKLVGFYTDKCGNYETQIKSFNFFAILLLYLFNLSFS